MIYRLGWRSKSFILVHVAHPVAGLWPHVKARTVQEVGVRSIAFVKSDKKIGGALTASGKGSARDRCAEATEGTQTRPRPRRYPSPAKRELAATSEATDARYRPDAPSTHFGPLLTHPGGSAADRPHHAHRTCKRRTQGRTHAPVALELTARAR